MIMGVKQKIDVEIKYRRVFIKCDDRGKFSLGNL